MLSKFLNRFKVASAMRHISMYNIFRRMGIAANWNERPYLVTGDIGILVNLSTSVCPRFHFPLSFSTPTMKHDYSFIEGGRNIQLHPS